MHKPMNGLHSLIYVQFLGDSLNMNKFKQNKLQLTLRTFLILAISQLLVYEYNWMEVVLAK